MGKPSALAFVLIILVPLVIASISVKAQTKTIVVPDDYPTIEGAIANASQGDTIFVKKGTYYETLKIEKSISLVGEDRDTTTIEGVLKEGVRVPLTIRQSNVSVIGFTLRGGYAGVQLHGNSCEISGNRITNVQSGIILASGSQNRITENIVESVKFYGIRLALASSNSIQKNHVSLTSDGISIMQSSRSNSLSENDVTNCSSSGIRLDDSDGSVLIENSIACCGIGVIIYVANDSRLYRNNFVDNGLQVSADEWYAKTWGYAGSTNNLDENFWSDYQSKYPMAKEIDASGIGDTPYVINENNTDYRPLMRKSSDSGSLPTPTLPPTTPTTSPIVSTQSPTSTGFAVEAYAPWIAVIIALSLVVVAGLGLLIYFKKRSGIRIYE